MTVQLNISFKDHIRSAILKRQLFKPTVNTKYTLNQILDVIEYVLITGSSWRSLDLPIFVSTNIKWQSIYYHFQKFYKANIFRIVYKKLLLDYFKKNKSGKLKYLSIDSSFILNAYASNVGYNGFYKKKRLSKLSLIVDSNGIPISALLARGNKSDQTLVRYNFKRLMVDIDYRNTNNKHKRYFLADAAYDVSPVREQILDKGICPIIWKVRRPNYQKFNEHETNIYKHRIIVENCFSWLFKCRRINKRYDKSTNNYMSFVYLAFIRLILGRF